MAMIATALIQTHPEVLSSSTGKLDVPSKRAQAKTQVGDNTTSGLIKTTNATNLTVYLNLNNGNITDPLVFTNFKKP